MGFPFTSLQLNLLNAAGYVEIGDPPFGKYNLQITCNDTTFDFKLEDGAGTSVYEVVNTGTQAVSMVHPPDRPLWIRSRAAVTPTDFMMTWTE